MRTLPSEKKAFIIRLFTYVVMTLSVVGLVILSLFYILGYRIDFGQHTVEQTGVVQFISTPLGATVEIDGKALPLKTQTKETVSPGPHEFVMWREGYETWRKSLDIIPGTLTWLNYTRLIPKKLTIAPVADIGTPASNIVSPDHRFMAFLPDASKPQVTVYELTRDKVPAPETYTFAADTYSEAAQPAGHQFSLIKWDGAGRFMIVRHQIGAVNEWLVFDRESGKIRSNISRIMDVDIQYLENMDGSGDHYLALIAGDVRRIDLGDETLSRPLVGEVSSFSFDNTSGTIAYVEVPEAGTGYRKVGIVKKDSKPVTMYRSDTVPNTPLDIQTAHYFGTDYVTVADGNKVMIYTGSFPKNENDTMKLYAQFSTKTDITKLLLSPTGRFVIAEYGNEFVGYDIERKTLSVPAILPEGSSPLKWLDDFILYYEHQGTLTIREFDGANIHDLETVAPGFALTLSQNGKYLYSVSPAENGHHKLQRLLMIID